MPVPYVAAPPAIHAPAVAVAVAPRVNLGSLRLTGGVGLSDKFLAVRASLEGEGWIGEHLAIGGRLSAGGDAEILGTRRNLYLAEPLVMVGSGRSQVYCAVLSVGLGLASREEVTPGGLFSTTPTTSTHQLDFAASVSGGLIVYGTSHFAFSVLARLETTGGAAFAATLNLGIGAAFW